MAGLVPAIHDLSRGTKNVDARDKPGHDELVADKPHYASPLRRIAKSRGFVLVRDAIADGFPLPMQESVGESGATHTECRAQRQDCEHAFTM